MSEAEKVRELPEVMKYITGSIIDIGCGDCKIVPEAFGVDGRDLPGVDLVVKTLGSTMIGFDLEKAGKLESFDTVFSSHVLEHLVNPFMAIRTWTWLLKPGGNLVLYLPDGDHYDNKGNPEHMQDMKYESFLFWFKRVFCGEGKNFRGEHLLPFFELVSHGLDVGPDRYSFWIVARLVGTEDEYKKATEMQNEC